MEDSTLRDATAGELLKIYASTLTELRRRGLIRSTNNPVADYTEYLVAAALNLTLATKSTTGYDATDSEGSKYQIKGRRLTKANRSRQLSFIRGLDLNHFGYLAAVLFNEDFSILRACVIPATSVEKIAKYVPHINGWRLVLRDHVWGFAEARDITREVSAVAAESC